MIKTLQKKFVVTAMLAVTILLLLLLSAINIFNAWTTGNDTDLLLAALSKSEAQQAPEPADDTMDGHGLFNPPTEDDKMSAVFFTVRFDDSDKVAQVDISHISSVTQTDAEALASRIYEDGKTTGKTGNFKYTCVSTADGRGVVYLFLDVSTEYYAVLRVAVLSALFGVACWLLMLLLVILLSRKAIRPIAENLQKQKQFVTDAGHEIKTPLAIILANTDAMELHNGENKWSRNIREQINRLSGLTQNLLTLAKSDEGSALLGMSVVSLSDVTSEMLQTFKAPMELKNLTLCAEIAPDISVRANKEQVSQLLSVLLDNAVKYSVAGSIVSLRLQRAGKMNLLQIENICDTLPMCAPDKLFDRFYRDDAARTQKNGGYGIGLSAAKAIVQLHRGTIQASYVQPSKIVFTVQLPNV